MNSKSGNGKSRRSNSGFRLLSIPTMPTLPVGPLFTPAKMEALGLSADAVHQGWWVGYKIEDAATWARVKSGELGSLSIQGVAEVV